MSENEWPKMAETEWDETGVSIDGSTPVTTVSVGGASKHNQPVAFMRSAGCAYCNRWAVDYYVGRESVVEGEMFNAVERRFDLTLIFFCDLDLHREAAADELLDRFGGCSNRLDFMELPEKVSEARRKEWKQ